MSDQDKRCGTCKWWESIGMMGIFERGECGMVEPTKARLPSSISASAFLMGPDGGTKCPCWEAKE